MQQHFTWLAMIYFRWAAIHCRVEFTRAVQHPVASVFLATAELQQEELLPADLGKFAKPQGEQILGPMKYAQIYNLAFLKQTRRRSAVTTHAGIDG
uniref:Uncharacterized protein n=1 Tax=Oryza punctata TaxID=4537 RepID=A0A0E0LSH7_ORYPU